MIAESEEQTRLQKALKEHQSIAAGAAKRAKEPLDRIAYSRVEQFLREKAEELTLTEATA